MWGWLIGWEHGKIKLSSAVPTTHWIPGRNTRLLGRVKFLWLFFFSVSPKPINFLRRKLVFVAPCISAWDCGKSRCRVGALVRVHIAGPWLILQKFYVVLMTHNFLKMLSSETKTLKNHFLALTKQTKDICLERLGRTQSWLVVSSSYLLYSSLYLFLGVLFSLSRAFKIIIKKTFLETHYHAVFPKVNLT